MRNRKKENFIESHRKPKGNETPDNNLRMEHKIYDYLVQIFKLPGKLSKFRTKEAKKIISNSKLVNAKDADGFTLLMKACIDNKLDIVSFLIDEFPMELAINERDITGNTALHYACKNSRPAVVKRLIERMRQFKLDINLPNDAGKTPIDFALGNGNQRNADIIIEAGLSTGFNFLKHRAATFREIQYYHRLSEITNGVQRQSMDLTKIDEEDDNEKTIHLPPISTASRESRIDSGYHGNNLRWPPLEKEISSKVACSKLLRIRSMQESSSYRESFPLLTNKQTPIVCINGSVASSNASTRSSPTNLQSSCS